MAWRLAALISALIASALWSVPALAQELEHPLPEATILHDCRARQISSGPAFDQVENISQRLAVARPKIHLVLVNNPVVNSWEVETTADTSLICVPIALVHVLGRNDGELAFFIAHEFGHAIDDRCKSLRGRGQIADHSASGAILGTLFGRSSGDERTNQRACETRADELGLNLITRAGYDPLDAVAALVRLDSYSGHSGAGPLARLAVLGEDHPITADRVRHIRKLIAGKAKPLPQ